MKQNYRIKPTCGSQKLTKQVGTRKLRPEMKTTVAQNNTILILIY